jgi:amino acid adenylation domain-containing protein
MNDRAGAQDSSNAVGDDNWASDFLDRLAGQDVHFSLIDGNICVSAPRGALTDAIKAEINAHRGDLIAHLAAAAAPRTFPLSSAQQRLWFLDRVNPGTPQYNLGGALRLKGPWDSSGAHATIERLIARHPLLNARIRDDAGATRVEILDHSQAKIDVFDFSGRPLAQAESEAEALAQDLLTKTFDLDAGLLAAFLVVKEAPDQHLIAICTHHIISDGWSLDLLFREFAALIAAETTGAPPALAPVQHSYAGYSAREARWLQSDALHEQVAYWQDVLKGAAPLLELPTDRPRPPVTTFQGRRWNGELNRDLTDKVSQLGQAHGATNFEILTAAWQTLMHRYSGQADVVVGTPVSDRDDAAFQNVVGCFINPVPLRTTFDGDLSFTAVIDRVKQSVRSALSHRQLPFDQLTRAVQAPRRSDHAPVFQVMFSMQPAALSRQGGFEIEPIILEAKTSPLDLTVEARQADDGMVLSYEYSTDLFDEHTIAALHERFIRILSSVCANPETSVGALRVLSDREQADAIEQARGARLPYEPACVHRLVEAQALARPNAVALRFEDVSVTYAELNARADRIAARLRRLGVGRGALVGVLLERGTALPEALLAVHKAGAAYLPLDPTHPPARLRQMLEQSQSACVVTSAALAPRLEDVTPALILEDLASDPTEGPDDPAPDDATPEDLAYVIYTSGSTGKPKGVEIEHRQFVSFLHAMEAAPGLGPDDVLLAVTTIAFDIAGLEFWGPLSRGGRVVIASSAAQSDAAALMKLIDDEGVTILQATPATWRLLLTAGWVGKPHLRALCGGEAMPRELAADLIGRVGELWNMYGPTETTVWSSAGHLVDAERISIGRPIANTDIFVLDDAGGLVPPGVIGELCIGGDGVARGYRFAPDLTADRFVERRLGGEVRRLYRTGDLGRYLPDGRLECLGRRDSQIKLRGYRIELEEIENTLRSHLGIRDAVVAAVERSAGDLRLVAYVVFDPLEEPTVSEMRAFAREQLPDYMVPSLFVPLDKLPLTPNGKIDRKALPEPFATGRTVQSRDPPATEMERTMAAIWQELLKVDQVGRDDNFFDLGGHSLLSMRVAAAAQQRTGRRLEPRALFFQSLRQVAAGLELVEPQAVG